MKVLINALGAHMGGALRHMTGFLPALARADGETQYSLLIRRSVAIESAGPNVVIERLDDDAAAGIVRRLCYDLWKLPRRLRTDNFDVVVSLTNFGPIWSSAKHILFQRNALYFYGEWLSGTHPQRRVSEILRAQYARAAMKRARFIVTPSRSMASAIQQCMPELRTKEFRVLYHGFTAVSMLGELQDSIRETLGRAAVKLLYVTHPAPHKGLEIAFQAIHELQRRGIDATLYATFDRRDWAPLVKRYEDAARRYSVFNRVVFLGNVPQAQTGELYKMGTIVVWPSLVESFGFPLLEAMACRVPIVAAGTEINREICGDAALYYSPLDGEQFADVLQRALCPAEQERLRHQCDLRMRAFDWGWDRYAQEFLQILQEA